MSKTQLPLHIAALSLSHGWRRPRRDDRARSWDPGPFGKALSGDALAPMRRICVNQASARRVEGDLLSLVSRISYGALALNVSSNICLASRIIGVFLLSEWRLESFKAAESVENLATSASFANSPYPSTKGHF